MASAWPSSQVSEIIEELLLIAVCSDENEWPGVVGLAGSVWSDSVGEQPKGGGSPWTSLYAKMVTDWGPCMWSLEAAW